MPDAVAPSRSLVVDDRLTQSVTREALAFTLLRPAAIVMWVACGIALLVCVAGIALIAALSSRVSMLIVALGVVLVVLPAAWVVALRISIGRSVRAAYPVGSIASAEVRDHALHTESALGSSDLAYAAIRVLHVGRAVVLLRVGSNSAVGILPRDVLTDDDLARLRSRTGASVPG
ncbi:hypothetical protein [Agromyces sp. GXS1127]|uniref:hypothetical protein n=1 Tax=Agromyces sp. GXS1127 TaxID=3424181 RepID=UPI003D321DB1